MPELAIHPVFIVVAAGTLLCVFARALMHKVTDFAWFAHTLNGYRIVPAGMPNYAAAALAAAEALVIVGLIVPASRMAAAWLALALLALYGGAIAVNLLRGNRRIDCGCGGAGQGLSWFLVLRNLLLAALAIFAAASPTADPIGFAGWVVAFAGIAALMLIVLGAEQLTDNWTWLLASNESHQQREHSHDIHGHFHGEDHR
jgi:uncharacterized membrane protein